MIVLQKTNKVKNISVMNFTFPTQLFRSLYKNPKFYFLGTVF